MKNKIIKAVVLTAVLAVFAALAVLVRHSVDSLDETTENDIVISGTVTKLPEGVELFSDSGAVKPPVWRADSPDGKHIYMVGSMHALPKSAYPMAGLKQFAEEADTFAFEIKSLDIVDKLDGTGIDYPEKLEAGDSLREHLSPEVYQVLTDRAKAAGTDLAELDRYQPWYVYTHLESFVNLTPPESSDPSITTYGLDRLLEIEANIEGKPKENIETQLDKKKYYPEMPEDVLGLLIMNELNSPGIDFYPAWSSGDLEQMFRLTYNTDGLTGDELALMERCIEYCITSRNRKMAARAEEFMSGGKQVLFVVGAAHFYGDEGIPALLEKDGYTVTRVQ